MNHRQRLRASRRPQAIMALAAILCAITGASGQLSPTIVDSGFERRRPPGHATGNHRKNVYRVESSGGAPPAPGTSQEEIGLTLWRLRKPKPTDNGARMLLQEPDESRTPDAVEPSEVVPERVEAGASLEEGQRLRLTVESPRPGFLYVIDQEEYADGSTGDPYLIFPTTRIRGGDNRVEPGLLVELPARSDRPNYFTVQRSRPDHTADNLTLLVAPHPISALNPGIQSIKIDRKLLSHWQHKWWVKADRLELEGGAGALWTEQEKAAGGGSRMLTQDDPLPQTVYRVNAKPGVPLMISVPLSMGSAQATKEPR